MNGINFESIKISSDARGLVFEPLDSERLPAQRNVHVVLTEPGAIRGNHFHENSTEVAVLVGPGLVRVRNGGEIQDILVPEGQAYQFTFAPHVSHAFQNTGTKPMLLVAFNTAPFDPASPDVHRDILIS